MEHEQFGGIGRESGQEQSEAQAEQEIITQCTEQYAAVTPEQARLTPELQKAVRDFRESGLFTTSLYPEGARHAGESGVIMKTNLVRYVTLGTSPENDFLGGGLDHHKTREALEPFKVNESLTILPLYKLVPVDVQRTVPRAWGLFKRTETETIQQPEPATFGDVVIEPSTKKAEPAVRLTYLATDGDVIDRKKKYLTNTWDRLSPEPKYIRSTKMPPRRIGDVDPVETIVQSVDGPEAENIERRTTEMLALRELVDKKIATGTQQGREGNYMSVSVTLPHSVAQNLKTYFEKNPQFIRPFFVSGGMDLMPYHLPPPYRQWDEQKPERPVLMREYREYTGDDAPIDQMLVANEKSAL